MGLEICYRGINELVAYEHNSRTHSDDQVAQIAASIREFGFTNPVLIDERGVIIAGHGRCLAAKIVGLETVPCIELSHLTEEQRRAYVIADNRLALNAGWDEDLLKLELTFLADQQFNLDLLGFSGDELDSLMAAADVTSGGLTDDDETPIPPVDPLTKIGDIWTLGNHRLMCGDSTCSESVKSVVGGGMVDMLLTDPPYNVSYEGGTKEKLTIKNDSMSDESFRKFLSSAFSACDEVMKAGSVFYIWHADSEGFNFRGACRDVGWQVRQCLIWNKSSLVLGRQDYQWKHEPCLYGWKSGSGHLWAADRKQTTVINIDKPQRNGDHPTMKPVALFEYQMLNNTKGGDIVLDLFGGSGTTLIAAEKNGRHARVMELDPKYCDVIIKRWQEYTGNSAVHAITGQPFGHG